MNLNNENLKRVWALLPSYSEDGINGTMMVFGDHQEWVGVRIETCEAHLAQEYCIDLIALRRRTGSIVRNKRHMPLIFSRSCKFIQFHYRHPDFANDGAYGIVRADVIRNIIKDGKHAKVVLANGEQINSLDQAKTLNKYLDAVKVATDSLPHLELGKKDYYGLIFDLLEKAFENRKDEWH